MKLPILSALVLTLCGPAVAGESFRVKDEGAFAQTGRHVEFADRYGWRSYEIDYRFGLDRATRRITDDSNLTLTIRKTDGSKWSYRCRPQEESRVMWANVNLLIGRGISVLTECRIAPRKFAKAVGLDDDLVGDPTLVFHVMIEDGKPRPGLQKGFYFLAAGQIEASPFNQYATQEDDPSNLGVLFASAVSYPHHPYVQPVLRLIP